MLVLSLCIFEIIEDTIYINKSFMKLNIFYSVILFTTIFNLKAQINNGRPKFDIQKDILLAQFDCKTDVDDLHTVAAFNSLIKNDEYKKLNFIAVAGTYGIQEGLYVPPNSLFQKAFGNQWVDAHSNRKSALNKVFKAAKETLNNKGNIWIAEGGQSDFSALLIMKLMKEKFPFPINKKIHIVQHSNWNEEVTSPELLEYVKKNSVYFKIPDGNVIDNGSPCFRTPNFTLWKNIKNKDNIGVWSHAIELGNKYNGVDNRYNNEAIANNGLDFSDLSEICWILGIKEIRDTKAFFNQYVFNIDKVKQ